MNPAAIAAVWLVAGVAGAAALPPLRLRHLGFLVPLAGLVGVLLAATTAAAAVPTADSGLSLTLDRTAQGVLALSAASTVLFLAVGATVLGPELRSVGIAGAAAVLVVATPQPVVWALVLLTAMGALALRWIAVAPGRPSLAGGRVGVVGAGALLAASPFLPLAFGATDPTRPLLVGALLAVGLCVLCGAVPLGGWAFGAMSALPVSEGSAWPLLLAPALLLSASRAPAGLPAQAVVVFGHILLVVGLVCASWQGVQAARRGDHRYPRVLLADLGLALAAIGAGLPGLALDAALFLLLTHALLAPVLLNQERWGQRTRTLAWALLTGLPPSPSFWARLLVLEAMASISPQAVAAVLLAWGALALAALLAMRSTAAASRPGPSALPGWLTAPVAWILIAAAAAAGAAPAQALAVVFGGR